MAEDTPVGVIGLGLMGAALAERLVRAGFAVIGFDIDANRCNTFKADGRTVAASASDLDRKSVV